MAYTDFDPATVEARFGVGLRVDELFPAAESVAVPAWLTDHLGRIRGLALVTEKVRSELLVAPILLAVRELSGRTLALFSGQRMDIDPTNGLAGECDFLLSRQEAVPVLRAPVVAVLEAKRGDIEAGLGQCMAQMVGMRLFNERAGRTARIYGCVTTGEDWQFLRLDDGVVVFDATRRYLGDLAGLLGVFARIAADTA
ncbi:MAG: hypothetical protein MUF18_16395 [Fimbriiglobus sp.]|jgi:hypothetical protein|nr:hypothetical protein [Fimbriiglobus sp.]